MSGVEDTQIFIGRWFGGPDRSWSSFPRSQMMPDAHFLICGISAGVWIASQRCTGATSSSSATSATSVSSRCPFPGHLAAASCFDAISQHLIAWWGCHRNICNFFFCSLLFSFALFCFLLFPFVFSPAKYYQDIDIIYNIYQILSRHI